MSEDKKMEIWAQSEEPPKTALRPIKGGRISGMTDINPQWRHKKLTELFGACGVGWYTEETGREFVPCGDEIAVFVDLALHVEGHNKPINGNGGSMFRVQESRGLRCNDEAVKMATTDALSVCCKQLGIGSAIYEGRWDGSKYNDAAPDPKPQPISKPKSESPKLSAGDIKWLKMMADCKKGLGDEMYYAILGEHGYESSKEIKKPARKAVYEQMTTQIEANAETAMEEK